MLRMQTVELHPVVLFSLMSNPFKMKLDVSVPTDDYTTTGAHELWCGSIYRYILQMTVGHDMLFPSLATL